MSKEAKNEIDLMLRQLGRRDGAARVDEQHLDADELNSYVANALPAAARARYMEHLADCANCRGLVVQLNAAQGPVVVQQSGSIAAPSALKQFLASLFSPMVLRYAVPALAVLVIMVVGFIVMRRENAPDSLARVVETKQDKSVTVAASPSPETQSEGLVQLDSQRGAIESPVAKASPPRGQISGFADDARTEQPAAAPVTANEPPAATPETRVTESARVAPPAPKVAATQSEEQDRPDREKNAPADAEKRQKLAEITVRQRDEGNKAPQPQATAMAPGAVSPLGGLRPARSGEAAGADERTKKARNEARDEAADKTAGKDDAVKEKGSRCRDTIRCRSPFPQEWQRLDRH